MASRRGAAGYGTPHWLGKGVRRPANPRQFRRSASAHSKEPRQCIANSATAAASAVRHAALAGGRRGAIANFLQRGLRQRGADCIAEFCNSRRICCRILHSRRAWHARPTPSRSTILKWRLDPQSIIELINKIVYVVILGVHFSIYFHILLESTLKLACVAFIAIY